MHSIRNARGARALDPDCADLVVSGLYVEQPQGGVQLGVLGEVPTQHVSSKRIKRKDNKWILL